MEHIGQNIRGKLLKIVSVILFYAISLTTANAKAVDELLPLFQDVPGISNLPVSNITTNDSLRSATVTIHGKSATIMEFKNSGKNFGAVIFNSSKLTDVVTPLKGTPLDDISFNQTAFVFVTKNNALSNTISSSNLPSSLQNIIGANKSILLNQGVHLFGGVSLDKSSNIGQMLSTIGAYKNSYPIKGKVNYKLFSGANTTELKNELMDSLDMKLKIDAMNLPSNVTLGTTALEIKSVNTNGTRAIDLSTKGSITASLLHKQVEFDFDIDMQKQKSNTQAVIKGVLDPSKTLTTSLLFENFTLQNMDFTLTKVSNGWKQQLDADAILNGQKINLSYKKAPGKDAYIDIEDKMTLAQMLGESSLPGLDSIKSNSIKIHGGFWHINLAVEGIDTDVYLFQPKGANKRYIAVTTADFSPDKFIPGTSSTPLKDATFQGVTFIYSPDSNNTTFAQNLFPKDIQAKLSYLSGDVQLKSGLNAFGHIEADPKGEMKTLLTKLGISDIRFPINGKFSPKIFSSNINTAQIKQELLDELDLKIKIPTPNIPEISKILTFNNGILELKGKTPKGAYGLDLRVKTQADFNVKSEKVPFDVDIEMDKANGTTELKFSGTSNSWSHPFGHSWLNLSSLTLDIDKTTTNGKSTLSIQVDGKTTLGKHSNLDIDVKIKENNGQIVDTYLELDGPIEMSEIPEIKNVPHSNKFTLSKIIITEHGVQADTTISGRATDAYIFAAKDKNGNNSLNMMLTQNGFTLTELIPGIKGGAKKVLKEIKFPYAAITFSQNGINEDYSSLTKVGQDALKNIFTEAKGEIVLDSGVAFVAGFHPKHAGGAASTLKGMGVHDGVIIMGEVSGLHGGTPIVKLEGKLSAAGDHKSVPSFMRFAKSEQLDFFITLDEEEVDLGIAVDIKAKIKKDLLDFDAKMMVQVLEEGFGLEVAAQMEGIWHKPFGIPGFSLGDVTMEFGTEDGGAKLGFGGTTIIANDKFTMASDVVLSEALVPEAAGFKATADKLPLLFLEEVLASYVSKKVSFDIPQGIAPEFEDVTFAFVSPGAEDATLGLTSEGFALKGNLAWLGKNQLGQIDVSITESKGLHAEGDIANIKLAGVLELKNNYFIMDAGPTSVPDLHIRSNFDFLGLKDKIKVDFDKHGIDTDADLSLTQDLHLKTDFDLSGIDMSVKHPEYKKADLILNGDLTMDVGKFITQPAKTQLTKVLNDLNSGFATAENTLDAAKKNVEKLTTKLNKKRAAVRAKRAKIEAKVQDAENRVNSLNSKLQDQWDDYHHCHGWFSKWPCRIKHGIEIGGLKIAMYAADEALRLAKTLVDHFPIDLDPEVAAIIAERDTALTALDIAEDAVKGADVIEYLIKEGIDKICDGMGDHIDLKKAAFSVDTKKFIEDDSPVRVAIDAEIFGKDISAAVAMKLGDIKKDIPYDLKQMEVMAAYALHYAVHKAVDVIPSSIRDKVLSAVAGNFAKKQQANKDEIAKYNFSAEPENAAEIEMKAQYDAYNQAYLVSKIENQNPLNHEKSERFNNELIEVGHTGLCLENDNGRITQVDCQNKSTRWSTRAVNGAPGVENGLGYMNIVDHNGNCLVPDGTWQKKDKTFDNIPVTIDEFIGDSKINIGQCVNTKQYYWKVLKHGDGWMQMANLATNQCLHFEDSNAIPGKATAVWKPCVGSANQVFKVADNTTPKYHADNIVLKNDQGGLCFGHADAKGYVPMVNCKTGNPARYDYLVDIRGYIKFVNRATGKCLQPSGYKWDDKMVEVACTQLDYQWWQMDQLPGGIRIINAETKGCFLPPESNSGGYVKDQPCSLTLANAIFTPLQNVDSGVVSWKRMNANHYNRSEGPAFNFPGAMDNGYVRICQVWENGNGHIGFVRNGDAVCTYNANGGAHHTNGNEWYELLWGIGDYEWQTARGYTAANFIVLGNRQNPSIMSTYACRTKHKTYSVQGIIHRPINETYIGWTHDGKTCNYTNGHNGGGVTTDFEVLSRKKGTYYKLKLSNE